LAPYKLLLTYLLTCDADGLDSQLTCVKWLVGVMVGVGLIIK